MSDLTIRDLPVNPPADYAEVQDIIGIRNVQSSTTDEAEAGQKLVPRPEDITGFESAIEPDAPVHVDKAKREKEVSHGHSD
ncbi:hypothetical protein BDY19DRAFT_993558 [Irpex rosettiformis]|uniref:Uncharacterized protein n=1 Tax=Irpex rosettiformis TaxID=378272 RepID=A0ACB8U583_9APHY|nr:hypothetical protein BDY19DRAFT_993558 [Irpex rosettiformis]